MRDNYVYYDLKKGEARVCLPEHCLSGSDISDKTFDEAIAYLTELRDRMAVKWILEDSWMQAEYIKADGSRQHENRRVRFTRLEIGWEQVPFEDHFDTCLVGIRPITDDEREGLEAEKQNQLRYRKAQYEVLKAEFEPDSA